MGVVTRKLLVIIIFSIHFKGNGKGPPSLIGMAAVESDARWMIILGMVIISDRSSILPQLGLMS